MDLTDPVTTHFSDVNRTKFNASSNALTILHKGVRQPLFVNQAVMSNFRHNRKWSCMYQEFIKFGNLLFYSMWEVWFSSGETRKTRKFTMLISRIMLLILSTQIWRSFLLKPKTTWEKIGSYIYPCSFQVNQYII